MDFIIFGIILYFVGIIGILINRKNFILFLMCLELMFLAVIIILVSGSIVFYDISGQIFSLFIITVAAAESAIGLSLMVAYYQKNGDVDLEVADLIRF